MTPSAKRMTRPPVSGLRCDLPWSFTLLERRRRKFTSFSVGRVSMNIYCITCFCMAMHSIQAFLQLAPNVGNIRTPKHLHLTSGYQAGPSGAGWKLFVHDIVNTKMDPTEQTGQGRTFVSVIPISYLGHQQQAISCYLQAVDYQGNPLTPPSTSSPTSPRNSGGRSGISTSPAHA